MRFIKYILLTFLFISISDKSFSYQQSIQIWDQEVQEEHIRNFEELTKVKDINLDKFKIFEPSLLAVDENRDVITYDRAKDALIRFKILENYEKSHSLGRRGSGPGEFKSPKDIKIDQQNNIWVSDFRQGRISIWNKNGNLVDSIVPSTGTPANLAILSDGRFVVLPVFPVDNKLFLKFDKNGKLTKSFQQTPLPEITMSAGTNLYFEGNIDVDGKFMFYSGFSEGVIRKYNLDNGELLFSRSTIENVKTQIPDVKEVNSKITTSKRSKNTIYASRDMHVADKKIYTLFSGTEYAVSNFIDVYSSSDGVYQYSLKLSNFARALAVKGERLYILHRYFSEDKDKINSISIYKMK